MTPLCTYRVQLQEAFTFDDLSGIVDYLQEMNISHIYLSPILEAVRGSNHGYDVTDFTRVSTARGGEEGLARLDARLRQMTPPLRLLLDIVPNHMAASLQNPAWRDVLQRGRKSRYWSLFDLRILEDGKITLPMLGEEAQILIENKEIRIALENGVPSLVYADHCFPLSDESVAAWKEKTGTDDLSALCAACDQTVVAEILASQHYSLSKWTTLTENLCYRRFFHVLELIGLRQEDNDIFEVTHATIFDLLQKYKSISGLRVDHIDGLADPAAYLGKLAPHAPIWVEKILGREEAMPDWPVKGTTGYEFIDNANWLFTDREGFARIENYWKKNVAKEARDFAACVEICKTEVLEDLFSPELNRLVRLLAPDAQDTSDVRQFLKALTVSLPVYRTYLTEAVPQGQDAALLEATLATARRVYGLSFAKAETSLRGKMFSGTSRPAVTEWQQLTGPVMAKGLEDRAHYRYTPLAALNEVGCAPLPAENDFFSWLASRQSKWPDSFNASTTHDTKRSEDVRCRLYALPEWDAEWIKFYESANQINGENAAGIRPATRYFFYQALVGTWPLIGDQTEEYRERIWHYMEKSVREANEETSWEKPNGDYESQLRAFVMGTFANARLLPEISELIKFLGPAGATYSLAAQTLKILSPGIPDIYQGTEIWDYSLVDPDNRRPVDYSLRKKMMDDIIEKENILSDRELLAYLSSRWRDGAIKLWLTRRLLALRRDLVGVSGTIHAESVPLNGEDASLFVGWKISGPGSPLYCVIPTASRVSPLMPGSLAPPRVAFDPSVENGLKVNLISADIDLSQSLALFPVVVFQA